MSTETPSVTDLLATRCAAASEPLHRDDPYRVALVIEGGGNRAAYSAGMSLALDEAGYLNTIDAIYGTSGGALNAAWLLTGQGRRWLPSWGWPSVAEAGVNDPRRLLRGGPLVDLTRLTDHVYEVITPMDFGAILANPIEFHPIATHAHTGESADLGDLIHDADTLKTALRASACLPLLAGQPVTLGGQEWLDGGLAEPVPLPTAIDQLATHVLVLRTRRANQPATNSTLERLALARYFRKSAPGAGRAHLERAATHRALEQMLSGGPRAGSVQLLQVRPPEDAHNVSRLTNNLAEVEKAIEIGRRTLIGALA